MRCSGDVFATAAAAAGTNRHSSAAVHPAPYESCDNDVQVRVQPASAPTDTAQPRMTSLARKFTAALRVSGHWRSLSKLRPEQLTKLPTMVVLPVITGLLFALLLTIILPAYLVVSNTASWETSAISYPSGLVLRDVVQGREFGLVIRLKSIDAHSSQVEPP